MTTESEVATVVPPTATDAPRRRRRASRDRSERRARIRGSRPWSRDTYVVIGLVLLVLLLVYAFAAPTLSGGSDSILATHPDRAFAAPSWSPGDTAHPILGADHLGRSLFGYVAMGLQTSIIIGVLVIILAGFIGWGVGTVSAYAGGAVDMVLGRMMDAVSAFPGILLALGIVTAVGAGRVTMIVVLVATTWVYFARVTRAQVLALKNASFVEAAVVAGARGPHIIRQHFGRMTLPMMVSVGIVQLPHVMLTEATLSFLGFGLQPPTVSLGYIISSERDYLAVQGWPITLAGGVLAVTCTAVALVGLGLRNYLDPGARR
jgi:peptide/nickel transport system permease protein